MLKGKVALVTGSTSGIGLGIARVLAAGGADLMLNGFGEAAVIEKLREEITASYGVRVAYSGADLSKADAAAGMIEQATKELGRIDVLVNNAGIQHVAPVHQFPIEKWDAIIAINLTSVFLAIRAALPQMLERNWGRIINIASVHGLVASAEKAPYVASKHGVVGLTKASGARDGDDRHHMQRDLPGMGSHAAGANADRRAGCQGEIVAGGRENKAAGRKTAVPRVRHAGATGRARCLSVLGRGRAAQRRGASRGRWMDSTIATDGRSGHGQNAANPGKIAALLVIVPSRPAAGRCPRQGGRRRGLVKTRAKRWLRQLGPGLITGAADDDPSGIATYSQAGAQFGYQLGGRWCSRIR